MVVRQQTPLAMTIDTGALAAEDAANYDLGRYAVACLICIQGLDKPVHVRVNAYAGTVGEGEATATDFDFLIPTTASKQPDVQTIDAVAKTGTLVKSVSLYFPTGTTGPDTAGRVLVRAVY
jgi:hypothetical protein